MMGSESELAGMHFHNTVVSSPSLLRMHEMSVFAINTINTSRGMFKESIAVGCVERMSQRGQVMTVSHHKTVSSQSIQEWR